MSPTGEVAKAAGFTLIEVIVVLGLLALVTAMIVPMMTGAQGKADTLAAARDVAAALRSTRNLAMMRGHAEVFLVDTAQGAYRPGGGAAARRLPGGVQLILITATQEQLNETVGGIRFFADGSSTGGGVRLSKGASRDQVLVDWLTGHISIGDVVHAAR